MPKKKLLARKISVSSRLTSFLLIFFFGIVASLASCKTSQDPKAPFNYTPYIEPVALEERITEPSLSKEIEIPPQINKQDLLREKINKCKIVDLFSMDVDGIELILGPPDQTGWIAGNYFVWEDASILIGNNNEGLSSQKKLLVAGRPIGMIHLESFGDIKPGAYFSEIKDYFNLPYRIVENQDTSHWNLRYTLQINIDQYKIEFNSDEKDGPAISILIWKN